MRKSNIFYNLGYFASGYENGSAYSMGLNIFLQQSSQYGIPANAVYFHKVRYGVMWLQPLADKFFLIDGLRLLGAF